MNNKQALEEARYLLMQLQYKEKYCKIETFLTEDIYTNFNNEKIYPRRMYEKHLTFWKAGANYSQRMFLAANRISKTTYAAIELYFHLSGHYPTWWEGKRFIKPTAWWVCGDNKPTVKAVLQDLLLGQIGDIGTGIIPRDAIDFDSLKDAVKNATYIDSFKVKHISGQFSTVEFKSYDSGRKSFQGTERSIWLDEECDQDVYSECLLRTATGGNIMMLTFTPLNGLTEFIETFTNGDIKDGDKGFGRWLQMATWDDVPHIDQQTKANILRSTPMHLRDARTKGIPILGSGAVYPITEDIFVEPFEIPVHYKRVFGLDYGWDDPTACLWAAIDPESNVVYIYAEHYVSQQPPSVHAAVIKQRNNSAGFTIPGVADPSGGGKSGNDGKLMRDRYKEEYQITFELAINSIEPGISKIVDMMISGRFKIFTTCTNFRNELKLYRRVDGKLVGKDHLNDVARYIAMSGLQIAKSKTDIEVGESLYKHEYQGSGRTDDWYYN